MRGRLGCIMALVALVGVTVAVPASGKPVKIPGTVVVDRITELSEPPSPSRDSVVYGHIESKPECLANRRLTMVAGYENVSGHWAYDTARTGSNGGFSGIGASSRDGNGLRSMKVTMKPKDIGTKRHPKTCKGDTFKVSE